MAVPPWLPLSRPPRCWLNTFTASRLAALPLIGWVKLMATELARGALRWLRVGLRAVMAGGGVWFSRTLTVWLK